MMASVFLAVRIYWLSFFGCWPGVRTFGWHSTVRVGIRAGLRFQMKGPNRSVRFYGIETCDLEQRAYFKGVPGCVESWPQVD